MEIQLFEVDTYRNYSFSCLLWGWKKSEVYKEKVNTRDELVTMTSEELHVLLSRELKSALK
jgi:hypothetical protein